MRAGVSPVSAALLRRIRARAGCAPGEGGGEDQGGRPCMVVEDFGETPWASLTFTGARHHVEIRLEGTTCDILAAVDELARWDDEGCTGYAGHFLADLQLTEIRRENLDEGRMCLGLRLEALTIEE